MTARSTRQQVARAVESQAGPHIGDVVFVRLWQAGASRARLERLADASGFPTSYLPKGLTPDQAWQHACRTTRVDGYLLRPIAKDDKAIVWGAVREDVDPDETDLDYALESRLALLRANSQTVFEHPAHPVCVAIDAAYRGALDSITTEHVRAMVKRVCRDNGGVTIGTEFFVPGQHASLLRSMKNVVEQLGGSQLWLLPIHDTGESRETIDRAVRADLQDEITTLADEIAKFDDSTQESTLERRLERFSELRERARLYAGILTVTHDDLLTKVSELETTVARMIGAKETDNG